MYEQQLQQLTAAIAVLHGELKNQSEQALALQQEGLERLASRLQEVNRLVEDTVANQLGAVSDDLQREIAKGGKKGLAELNAKVEELTRQMGYFAQSAADTEQRLNAAGRSVLVKIGYLSAFALVCVIGSALWLGFHYSKLISEKKESVENLEMLLQADIVKCGGQLCAKVGKNTPAQLRKSGYMLIERK